MENQLSHHQGDVQSNNTIQNNIFTQVMGEDKCEYARTYGLGIYVNDLHGRPHQGHQDARG